MPDPEEIQLIDDNDEANDPLVQLISGQGTKQEHDQQDFDDSNFDNTLEDTGEQSFIKISICYFIFGDILMNCLFIIRRWLTRNGF